MFHSFVQLRSFLSHEILIQIQRIYNLLLTITRIRSYAHAVLRIAVKNRTLIKNRLLIFANNVLQYETRNIHVGCEPVAFCLFIMDILWTSPMCKNKVSRMSVVVNSHYNSDATSLIRVKLLNY